MSQLFLFTRLLNGRTRREKVILFREIVGVSCVEGLFCLYVFITYYTTWVED